MISNPKERARMALNAYHEVRANRTLEHRAHEWHEAIEFLWEEAACREA